MKKILITGAFGFVGNNLSKFLKMEMNCFLIAVDLSNQLNSFYDIYYSWDDFDLIELDSIDVIIHLAGKSHDIKNEFMVFDYYNVNAELTKKVFDNYLTSNVRKFIFFSSIKAVIDKANDQIVTEDFNPNPKDPFGMSKLIAEKYLVKKKTEWVGLCKNVFILRPSMIHGPGNRGNLNLLYKIVTNGFPWPLGAFDNMRSFTSILNLQYIIQELIDKNIDSGIYNISDDDPLSTNDVIRLMADSLGQKHRIWRLPTILIKSFARCGDILKLPLNSERLGKLTESYVVSNKKIKEALGIHKMPVTATDGMKYTLNSFNEKNK